MKKKLTKQMLLGVLAAAMFGISASDAEAQNFTNTGSGTYNAACGGVIKMKNNTGTITGNSIGTDASNAIQGIVEWSSSTGTQTVPGYFYTLLLLSGGNKDVLTGVNVVGGACSSLLAGYTGLGLDIYPYVEQISGPNTVTYNGTFNYSGILDQAIYPQDNYVTLNIAGAGNATVLDNESVTAQTITTDAAAPVVVAGTLNLTTGTSDFNGNLNLTGDGAVVTGTGTVTIDGALDLAGTSTFSVSGVTTGDVTVSGATTTASGTSINITNSSDLTFTGTLGLNGAIDADDGTTGLGTLNLDGTTTIGASGSIALSGNMEIGGAITNASADGANLDFACASTVTYNGATNPQLVLPTADVDGNRYGNLVLSGGNKRSGTATYGNNVNVCSDFTLGGGNLDMYTNTGTLKLNDPAATVTYTALAEVEGLMSRVTDLTARTYSLNNAETKVTLSADNDNPALVTLNSRPGQAPDTYVAASDVNRDLNLAYSGNLGAFNFGLAVGYLNSEASGKTAPNAWTGGYTEGQLRFYEANGTASEKISTGQVYAKTNSAAGTAFGTLSLAGIGSTSAPLASNGIAYFASGNDIVMRSGPTTYYSIVDGRWSNPNTWDEGTTPTAIDNVEIRTTVFAGIDAPFMQVTGGTDETAANNTLRESSLYGANAAANMITIANKTDFPTQNPAFILGNEDNGTGWLFKTALTSGNSIINNNTVASSVAFGSGIAAKTSFNPNPNPGFSGIWITPWSTGANAGVPALQTNQIENKGTVNNEGVIEIGQ